MDFDAERLPKTVAKLVKSDENRVLEVKCISHRVFLRPWSGQTLDFEERITLFKGFSTCARPRFAGPNGSKRSAKRSKSVSKSISKNTSEF